MTGEEKGPAESMAEELPSAIPRKPRLFSVIWMVPLVAAIVTGGILYKSFWAVGPKITILFKDGSGIRSDQTILQYRGVKVGEVRSITLSKDQEHVVVEVQLDKSAAGLAREGSQFWIVRPEIGVGEISGLETIVSGPYIEVSPGSGPTRLQFIGEKKPLIGGRKSGLKIVLTAARTGSLKAGTAVYYRGVQVGTVQDHELSPDARTVKIHVFIDHPYAPLVRPGSKFWNISGVDVALGLLGVKINMQSLETVVGGGIAFATPPEPAGRKLPREKMVFELYDKPEDDWLKWSPAIKLEKAEE